jgi:hypothetical protein
MSANIIRAGGHSELFLNAEEAWATIAKDHPDFLTSESRLGSNGSLGKDVWVGNEVVALVIERNW